MLKEGPANDEEDYQHQGTRGYATPEPKESAAQKPAPKDTIRSLIVAPLINGWQNSLGEPKKRWKPHPIFGIVFTVFVCVSGIFKFLGIQRDAPAAALAERELPGEFQPIPAPKPSSLLHSTSTFKGQSAFVQTSYDTTLSYREVSEHYDNELLAQGWKYSSERNSGRLITRCYTKGVYQAHVTYEEGIFGGRTFGLGMSWGMEMCY